MEKECGFGFGRSVDLDFAAALSRVETTLREQGLEVVTRLDMKEKIWRDIRHEFPNYVILGTCNTHVAYKALSLDPVIGLNLPCSVIVYEEEDGRVYLMAMDPVALPGIAEGEPFMAILEQVRDRLRRALDKV